MDKNRCSFYSSSLLDLQSSAVNSVCAAWQAAVKLTWKLDRATHRYFIPSVLAPGLKPIKAALLGRFHNFFLSTGMPRPKNKYKQTDKQTDLVLEVTSQRHWNQTKSKIRN